MHLLLLLFAFCGFCSLHCSPTYLQNALEYASPSPVDVTVYKANIHISYVRVKDYFNFLIILGDRVERKLVQEVSVLNTVQFSYCYDGPFSFFYNFS